MSSLPSKVRILVVDDSPDICLLLENHFKLRGFYAQSVQCGSDALKTMEKNLFDIVVCDIIMPAMKGTELLQKIKKLYPVTHLIMITGYVSLEHLLACMRHGADTCIFKPMNNFSELDASVDRAMESMHRWEEKIIALKGLKESYPDSLEVDTDLTRSPELAVKSGR